MIVFASLMYYAERTRIIRTIALQAFQTDFGGQLLQ
jgi:hypothetical protein